MLYSNLRLCNKYNKPILTYRLHLGWKYSPTLSSSDTINHNKAPLLMQQDQRPKCSIGAGPLARKLMKATALAAFLAMLPTEATIAADLSQAEPTFTPAEPQEEAYWRFTIAPYAWMAGLSGDVSVAGYGKAHADVGFSDVFKSLDFAAMVVAEARYDRVALLSDFVYLKVTNKVKAPMGFKAKVGTDVIQWTPSLTYSLFRNDNGYFDVVAGARMWSVEASIRLTGPATLDYRADDQWIDAIGGVRASLDLTDKLFAHGWALAGAGGSKHVWDLLGGVGYRFGDKAAAVVGYRAQGVDYKNGSFEFDAVMKGPAVSALLHF